MSKFAPHMMMSSSAKADDPLLPVLHWRFGSHGRGELDARVSRGMAPCWGGA
jgi:hypothetical protein